MRTVQIHTLEKGALGPRPPTVKVDTIVVHYTDTAGLRRYSNDRTWNLKRTENAFLNGGIAKPAYEMLKEVYGEVNAPAMSDGVIMALIAASTPREACAHYYISSRSIPGEKEAEIVEFVPEHMQAHHIGEIKPTHRTNQRSVGIELVYPGPLSNRLPYDEALATYERWGWGNVFSMLGPDGKKRWYTDLNRETVAALEELCTAIAARWPIKAICPHTIFCKSRIDPEPPVNLEALRSLVGARVGRKILDKPPR
jgi:hypothetical protein